MKMGVHILLRILLMLIVTAASLFLVHLFVSQSFVTIPQKSDVFFISNTRTCSHWSTDAQRSFSPSGLMSSDAEALYDLSLKLALDDSSSTNSLMAYDCLEKSARLGCGRAQFVLATLWDFDTSAFRLGCVDPEVDPRLSQPRFGYINFCSDHNGIHARDIKVVSRDRKINSTLVNGDAARMALFWYRAAAESGINAAMPPMLDLRRKLDQERDRYLGKMKADTAIYSACWLLNRDPLHKDCRCRCPTVRKYPKKLRAKVPCQCPRYNDASLAMQILGRAAKDGNGSARLALAVAEEILIDPLFSFRDAEFKDVVAKFYGDARTLCRFAYPKGSITNSQVVAYVTSLYRRAIEAGDPNAPGQLIRFRKRVAATMPVRPKTFREKVADLEKAYIEKVDGMDLLPEWQLLKRSISQIPVAITNAGNECSKHVDRILSGLSKTGTNVPKSAAFGRVKKELFGVNLDSGDPGTRKRSFDNWFYSAIRMKFAAETCLPPCVNSDYRWRLEEIRFLVDVLEKAYLWLRRFESQYGLTKDVEEMRAGVDSFCDGFFFGGSPSRNMFGADDIYRIFICQMPYPVKQEIVDRLERCTGRKWQEPKIRHWRRMGVHGFVTPKHIHSLMESEADPYEIFERQGRIIDDLWASSGQIDTVSKYVMQEMILETIARHGTIFSANTDALDLLATCSVLVESADFEVCTESQEALVCFGRYLANCSETSFDVNAKANAATPVTLEGHRKWLLNVLVKPLRGFSRKNGKDETARLLGELEEIGDLSHDEIRDLKRSMRFGHIENLFIWLL